MMVQTGVSSQCPYACLYACQCFAEVPWVPAQADRMRSVPEGDGGWDWVGVVMTDDGD